MKIPLDRSVSLTLTADTTVRVRIANPGALVDYLKGKDSKYDEVDLMEFALEHTEAAVQAGATDLKQLPGWRDCPPNTLTFGVENVDVFFISNNHPDEDGNFQSRMRYGQPE